MVDTPNDRIISRNIVAGLVRGIDVAVCIVTAVAAFGIYVYDPTRVSYDLYYLIIGLAAVVQINAFQFAGLYRPLTLQSIYFQLPRVWLAWTCVLGVLIAILFVSKSSAYYLRAWMIIWYFSGLITFTAIRVGLVQYLRHGLKNGALRQRVIVVGGGEQGCEVIQNFNQAAKSEVCVLGYFDDRAERVPERIAGSSKLGKFSDIVQFVRQNRLDLVILALPLGNGQRVLEILKALSVLPVDICVSANAAGIHFSPDVYRYVGNIPLLSVLKRPMAGWDYVIKSLEDRVIAVLALVILLPLMILIAIVIKLDSPGPVLFKQNRRGFNDEIFQLWKFRTMQPEMEDPDCVVQTTMNDARVTRIGAFLRKTSLDELPQLVNVLKGDMSIVGPRPHALETKAEGRLFSDVVDTYAARHKVKPGITGWAQVNGWRGETDTVDKIKGRVNYDLYYIENWSIWLDIWIILKSAPIIFYDKRAY